MHPLLSNGLKRLLSEATVARLQARDHWLRGEPELRLLGGLCARNKTAIDVGANIGTYTYFMRKYAKGVIAYEPNPELSRRLARLYPDVRVRGVAVSDHPMKVVLSMPVANGSPTHELASISQTFHDDREVIRIEVDAVKLDDEPLADVGFLKIDAEQHEKQVLLGALKTIDRWQPIVMTETTPLLYEDGLVAQFRFLTDLGFIGWFTFMGRAFPFDQFDPEVHANPKLFGSGKFVNPNAFFFPRKIAGDSILNR